MAYVIAEACIGVKDTACADACPVDSIHPRKNEEIAFGKEPQLSIDPAECIDCGACVPVCPVSAIFAIDDLPKKSPKSTPTITNDERSQPMIKLKRAYRRPDEATRSDLWSGTCTPNRCMAEGLQRLVPSCGEGSRMIRKNDRNSVDDTPLNWKRNFTSVLMVAS